MPVDPHNGTAEYRLPPLSQSVLPAPSAVQVRIDLGDRVSIGVREKRR